MARGGGDSARTRDAIRVLVHFDSLRQFNNRIEISEKFCFSVQFLVVTFSLNLIQLTDNFHELFLKNNFSSTLFILNVRLFKSAQIYLDRKIF